MTFIAKHYVLLLAIAVSFIVSLRVMVHIFIEEWHEWASSSKEIIKVVSAIAGLSYILVISSFWLSRWLFGSQNIFFIMLYYMIIFNAATLYVLRSYNEGTPFQLMVASLNIFHIAFTIIFITPPQYFNMLGSDQRGCIIDTHCRNQGCALAAVQEKRPDASHSAKCENFLCTCKK